MKQSINLYQGKKETREERLNALEILKISGGFLVLLILMTLYQWANHVFIKIEEERLETILARVQKESQAREQILTNKQAKEIKEGLEKEGQRLEEELKTNQLVITTLGQVGENKNKGFSSFMTALAKEGFPEIWMTEFEVKRAGEYISIQGMTFEPQHIPRLLENFGKEDVFKGKNFQVFKMVRSETDPQKITFILQTVKEKTP